MTKTTHLLGRLFEGGGGGAYFKFRPIGGALIQRGRLFERALIRRWRYGDTIHSIESQTNII